MTFEKEDSITVVEGAWSPVDMIRDIVESGTQEDSFYVMEVGEVVAKYRHWKKLMPRVEPFYAVKCNSHKMLVATLAALGAGFDCASKAEIELVTSLGVDPDRIIFANPAKMLTHMRYSSAVGVNRVTFDSKYELDKIKTHMPQAQLVLRIRCDAKAALYPMGNKFGCDPISEAPSLLEKAATLGLEVMGVSFHVGSCAMESEVFKHGIAACRSMFDIGASKGHTRMHLVDLGGGFPGERGTDILEVSQVINSALKEHFPNNDVRVIAEPGRYFAVAPYTLATCVHSKRELKPKTMNEETHTMYFVGDGVFSSFSTIFYQPPDFTAKLLYPTGAAERPCSLWGPTLCGKDCVMQDTWLPPLDMGDWLYFRDMGAYTFSLASTFNGFPLHKVQTFVDAQTWSMLKELHPLTSVQSVLRKRS